MAKKRFRSRSGKRGSQRDQRLIKQVRELYDSDDEDDSWSEQLGDDLAETPKTIATRASDRARAEQPPEVVEADGPRFDGMVVSLASGLAWIEPQDPDALLATDGLSAEDGPLLCILPSALAQDQQSRIAVGDQVVVARHGDDHRVIEVRPRRTFLARPDPLNPRLRRVVVANVDVVVQVASVRRPPLRPALVDRYLVAIQQGGADAVLCINKIDLVPADERAAELRPLEAHHGLLTVLPTSAETGEGIDTLRQILRGKTAAFVGHSGVGKSSLVNALNPAMGAKTGAVSVALDKGRHTTTRSSLYDLGDGIRVVDTPGIRELGLSDLTADQLRLYFPDLQELSVGCRFSNCTHDHEPDCAVRQAAASGELPASRFETYLRILGSLEE